MCLPRVVMSLDKRLPSFVRTFFDALLSPWPELASVDQPWWRRPAAAAVAAAATITTTTTTTFSPSFGKMRLSVGLRLISLLLISQRGLQAKTYQLGLMCPRWHFRIGWDISGAAATMAIDLAKSEGRLPNTDIRWGNRTLWSDGAW